jgi:hypothetical protein
MLAPMLSADAISHLQRIVGPTNLLTQTEDLIPSKRRMPSASKSLPAAPAPA